MTEEEVEVLPYRFAFPSTISVSGATSSGKTEFVKRLIREREDVFQHAPTKIVYCYGAWQDGFDRVEGVDFREGLDVSDLPRGTLLVIDDLMDEVVKSDRAQHLFTRGSHHNELTVVYLNQNAFCQGKYARTIALNSQYMVLFRNPRHVQQIDRLAGQLGMPEVRPAYRDATDKPYGYLVVDLHPANHTRVKLTSLIFPGEDLVWYAKRN